MATLTAQGPTALLGVALTLAAAAAGGDQFTNDGNKYLVARNGHASAARTVTVTVPAANTYLGLVIGNVALAIAAGKVGVLGPFPTGVFNDANGYAQITYSDSAADITVAVVTKGA